MGSAVSVCRVQQYDWSIVLRHEGASCSMCPLVVCACFPYHADTHPPPVMQAYNNTVQYRMLQERKRVERKAGKVSLCLLSRLACPFFCLFVLVCACLCLPGLPVPAYASCQIDLV